MNNTINLFISTMKVIPKNKMHEKLTLYDNEETKDENWMKVSQWLQNK